MASYQLRILLTSVKGYLSMVLERDAGKVNPQQAKMLNQAFTSAQRIAFLITDLLNVSRLKTGKFIIDAAPVNLGTAILEEVGQLKEAAEAKNIQLTYKKQANFPELILGEVKIRQVIMNFMDNAIHYTPNGATSKLSSSTNPPPLNCEWWTMASASPEANTTCLSNSTRLPIHGKLTPSVPVLASSWPQKSSRLRPDRSFSLAARAKAAPLASPSPRAS